ncbi:TetR/AcrR family transcriptional regulator [Nocardia sp. NBC_01377]|uniref:TetR/AcrR family transcriptional regulator n=1 Tax=Nocardia sp. NBC_01377 TaxID=2903595 RepID=UPI00324F6421
MRADAQRNRASITDAALLVFAEHGGAASMETIAHRAGLSVGALYRHFPDRRTLVEHIAVDALRDLLAFAQRARDDPDTTRWEALRAVVVHCVGLPLAMTRTLRETPEAGPVVAELITRTNAILERLTLDAQREGSVRGDLTAADIVRVLEFAVCRPGARAEDPLLTVVLDGLRS